MVEPEVAFNDLYDNMELAEQFVEYVVQRTLKNRAEELKSLERDLTKLELIKGPFPRLHYDEAAAMIKKENPDFVIGDDFGGTDETIVSSKFDKPLFVHHYPAAVKAFYMKGRSERTRQIDELRLARDRRLRRDYRRRSARRRSRDAQT